MAKHVVKVNLQLVSGRSFQYDQLLVDQLPLKFEVFNLTVWFFAYSWKKKLCKLQLAPAYPDPNVTLKYLLKFYVSLGRNVSGHIPTFKYRYNVNYPDTFCGC